MAILQPHPRSRPWTSPGVAFVGFVWALTAAAITPAAHDEGPLASAPPYLDPGASIASAEPERTGFGSPAASVDPITSDQYELHRVNAVASRDLGMLTAHGDPARGCRPSADGINFEDGVDFPGPATPGRGWFQQTSLDRLMLCARALGEVHFDEAGTGIRSMGEGSWLVLAVRGEGVQQRMEITGTPDGFAHTWIVDGEHRPFDTVAAEWRDAMIRVIAGPPAAARLRGREARLRGDAARTRGAEAQLRGEIASVRGETARLQGEAARLRGEEARLRAEGAALNARVSILSNAQRVADDPETGLRIEEEIQRIGREMEAIEARFSDRSLESESRQADLAARRLESEAMIAEIEARIAQLDFEADRQEIDRRIVELDAAARAREIDDAVQSAQWRLRELIREIR